MLVTANLGAGGSERQLAGMANYWATHGVRVTLVSWSGRDYADFYPLDTRVRRRHLHAPPRPGAFGTLASTVRRIWRLRRLIGGEQPDAVISFITENNVLTLLAGMGLKTRIIVSERAHPALDLGVSRVWRMLRKWLYPHSAAVVAQTRETAHWIEQNCRASSRVIPNALRLLPPASSERQSVVLAVGRLVRQKGFDLLLAAFARIASEFPEWKVVIVGEGPERENLRQQRDTLGLAARVELIGHSDEVESWMARAGLVVQPSRFEGFPNVVLEAMGMGAAVVSADCLAGPADLIRDGVNGRLVPVEDVAALAEAMRTLLSQPDLRAQFGREALAVRERFREERVMALWNDCLVGVAPHAVEM